jgi:hypothetical protein
MCKEREIFFLRFISPFFSFLWLEDEESSFFFLLFLFSVSSLHSFDGASGARGVTSGDGTGAFSRTNGDSTGGTNGDGSGGFKKRQEGRNPPRDDFYQRMIFLRSFQRGEIAFSLCSK